MITLRGRKMYKVDLTKKPFNLNEKQIKWVEDTIASMTLEEKIGQLFVHMTGHTTDEEAIKAEIAQMHMGGIRFNPRKKEEMWEMNRNFQKNSKIPVLSAVNVEAGGNGASSDGTNVGQQIKVAATGDSSYAYKMGQICGKETVATGSNWAFSPIVDVTYNWHNPVISTRSFGNDPDLVLEFSKAYFKGISESGVVCAMKHFPGDGLDERDQHVATSVNTFSCEEWDATFGKIYSGLIEEGVQAVMTGHIMLPSYQKFFNPDSKDEDLLPATICKELTSDLLRGKLGFNGLVVTDASHMVGLAGRAARRDIVPGSIMAGCDMFLFYNDIEEDIKYMTDAYLDGRLTEERLMDALRRILGLKAVVGLDTFTMDKFPSKEGLSIIGCQEHKKVSEEVSDKAITLAKQVGEDIFPVVPERYKRILLVPVGPNPSPILVMAGMGADGSKLTGNIKDKLEAKGFEVEIYEDPMQKKMAEIQKMTPEQFKQMVAASQNNDKAKKGAYGNKQSIEALTGSYDLVICVANVSATMRTTQRLEWAISKGGWDNPWYVNELPVIFASFNCPFHLADVPQIKNFINCYDAQESSVDAFVKKISGESEFKGQSTVDVFCGLIDTRF
jgi:beta-N-acetylhexosaminidase